MLHDLAALAGAEIDDDVFEHDRLLVMADRDLRSSWAASSTSVRTAGVRRTIVFSLFGQFGMVLLR